MAFPKDLAHVNTNLTPEELREVVRAIEANKVSWIPRPENETALISLGPFDEGRFNYLGSKFEITEMFERVTSINRVG